MSVEFAPTVARRLHVSDLDDVISLIAVLGFGAICVALAVGGFSDYDDHYYLRAADGWLTHPPYIAPTLGEVRLPFVFAIAASFRLLGRSEMAIMLPTILSYFGVLVLTFRMVASVADRPAAVLAGLLVACTPFFPSYARIPFPDEMELFLTLLSLWFFLRASERDSSVQLLLSGATLGVSWILRESCATLIVLYGCLFLLGFRIKRRRYFLIGLGFLPVIAGEMLLYLFAIGDPLYRFYIDAHPGLGPSAHVFGGTFHGRPPPFSIDAMKQWVPNSVIHVHWLIDPYIDFLTNGSYGFICYTGLWSAFVLISRRAGSARETEFARLIGGWALCALIVVIYVMNLRPQPRYFNAITWTMAVLTALWVREGLWRQRRAVATAVVSVIVLSDLYLTNLHYDPLYKSQALASYAKNTGEPVWSDGDIGGHPFIFETAGVASQIHIAAKPNSVPAGALYFTTRKDSAALAAKGWTESWESRPGFALLVSPFEIVQKWLPAKATSVFTRGYPELVVLRAP